jgi:hypothetical protein
MYQLACRLLGKCENNIDSLIISYGHVQRSADNRWTKQVLSGWHKEGGRKEDQDLDGRNCRQTERISGRKVH